MSAAGHGSDALTPADGDFELTQVGGAAGVVALARALYGPSFSPAAHGVLHVTAVDGHTGRTLRIDEHAPKSHADTFVLNLARARADAIVITGQILRDEPRLSYAPGAPGPLAPALRAYREQLGHTQAPWLVVLTRGAELPLSHPVFHDAHTRPLIYGPEAGVSALRTKTSAEVVGTPHDAELGQLVGFLRGLGAHTISFEAGPSTTRQLYDPAAPLLDELCLTTYQGPPLLPSQLAEAPPARPASLLPCSPARHVRAPSGAWSFARFRRVQGTP